mgnify:CR=1
MLFCAENIENNKRGVLIPIPNNMKLIKLLMKLIVEVLRAKRTVNEAGLQGRTISPKKNPNMKELQ